MSAVSPYQQNLFDTRYKSPESDESSWKDLFERVHTSMATYVASQGLPVDVGPVREDMNRGRFVCGSPILWNVGTPRRSAECVSSCYTGRIGDSLESFREADADAEKVYVSTGGFGVLLDSVRPRGTFIRHCSEGAMGAMCNGGPALRIEGTTGYITSSGRSRGAYMMQIDSGHPDAVEFMLKKAVHALNWLDDWSANATAIALSFDEEEVDLLHFINEFSSRFVHSRWWPSVNEVSTMLCAGSFAAAMARGIVRVNQMGRVVPMVTDWGLPDNDPMRYREANRDWELPLQNCNMSVRFSDEFMRAVEQDLPWTFAWFSKDEVGPDEPIHCRTDLDLTEYGLGSGLRDVDVSLLVDNEDSMVMMDHRYRYRYSVVITTWQGLLENLRPNRQMWRDSDYSRFYRQTVVPAIECYGSSRIMAKDVWDLFCRQSWDHADPAAVFSSTYARFNPTCEAVYGPRLSNPCAEFVCPAGGSCNLGSLNLRECMETALRSDPGFRRLGEMSTAEDWTKFMERPVYHALLAEISSVAWNATDLMTVLMHYSRPPVEYIRRMSFEDFRTIGIGLMGLAEAFMMAHTRYGSEFSRRLAAAMMSEIALSSWERSFELAQNGLPKPLAWVPERMTTIFNIRAESAVKRGLHQGHVDRWTNLASRVARGDYATHTCVTSVAPTGTISMVAGWVTGGVTVTGSVEPVFSWNVKRSDNSGEEILIHDLPSSEEHAGQPWMVTAMDGLSPMDHIEVQAAVCDFTCMSVSKTINMPSTATVEDLSEVYFAAWRLGIASTAPFVDGCKPMQVLSALECPSGECAFDVSSMDQSESESIEALNK